MADPSTPKMAAAGSIVQGRREASLQILRFVAAAMVLVTHITFYFHERVNAAVPVWYGGAAGVPIFFVVSGFVMYVSGTRLPRDTEGAWLFLRRRLARVLPLYWLITTLKIAIALALPAVVLHNRPDLLKCLGSYVLYPMFNAEGDVRPIHGVGWTLLHEMFFYYVFSLSLLLRQPPPVFTSIVIIGFWVIGLIFPPISAPALIYCSGQNLNFVVGMLLAAVHKRGFHVPGSVAILMLIVGASLVLSPGFGAVRQSLLGDFDVEAGLTVAAFLWIPISGRFGLKRLLAALGDSSYSTYMIHPIVAPAACLIFFKYLSSSFYICASMAFLCCIAIAHLIYLYVERPLNGKAGRLLGNRSTTLVPAQSYRVSMP